MSRALRAPPLLSLLSVLVFLMLLQGCAPASDESIAHESAPHDECLFPKRSPDNVSLVCIRVMQDGMAMTVNGKAGKTYEHIDEEFTFTKDGRVIYRAVKDGKALIVAGSKEGKERYDHLWSGPQVPGDIQRFFALDGDTFHWVNMTMRGKSFTEERAFASRVPDGMTIDWPAESERESTYFAVDSQKMQFSYPVLSRGGKKALMFRDGIDPFFDDVCCTQFSSDGETAVYIATDKRKGQSAVVIRNERRRKIGRWHDGIAAPRIDLPAEGEVSYDAWWNDDYALQQFAERL